MSVRLRVGVLSFTPSLGGVVFLYLLLLWGGGGGWGEKGGAVSSCNPPGCEERAGTPIGAAYNDQNPGGVAAGCGWGSGGGGGVLFTFQQNLLSELQEY